MMLSSDNENHKEPKAIKAAEEIKKQHESEQLNVDPGEIIEGGKETAAFSRQ